MLLRVGVSLEGLHPVMRPVLKYAERAFELYAGREAIITSALDREHSAGSFHYYGMACDFRINDLTAAQIANVVSYLRQKLPDFDVLEFGDHLHIEPSNALAKRLLLMA